MRGPGRNNSDGIPEYYTFTEKTGVSTRHGGLLLQERNGAEMKGDVNGEEQVILAEAILALQVLSGQNPAGIRLDYPGSNADVTGNQRIGLEAAIYILQKTAGLR